MPFNNPRTHEYLLQGIAWSRTAEELDWFERFAQGHFDGAALEGLHAGIRRRRRVLLSAAARAGAETPERTVHRTVEPHERMMDEIAGATSAAEVDHLSREVAALFARHPRRKDLECALDGKRELFARQMGT
jgi:hypothetical protein